MFYYGFREIFIGMYNMVLNKLGKKGFVLIVFIIVSILLVFGCFIYFRDKDYFSFINGDEYYLSKDDGNGNNIIEKGNEIGNGKNSNNDSNVGKDGGNSEGKDDVNSSSNKSDVNNLDNNENNKNNNENVEDRNKNDKSYIEDKILVHVQGAVNRPGVVECVKGNRISDAIEKAGGLKSDANLKDINLVKKVEDEMKIYIPNNSEVNSNNYIYSDVNDNRGNINNSNSSSKSGIGKFKVNINKATQTELETIPGVGPSTALKIINYRKEKGRFSNVNQLKEVSGIGDVKFEKMKKFVEV